MTKEAIILTLVSSIISGVLGVVISSMFYSRLETRRNKFETARKMFGSKHEISGNEFQSSINETIIVFSDSPEVIKSVQAMFNIVETPLAARSPRAADDALINLMKAMCKNLGINYKDLPDSYYLKYFSVPDK